MMRILLISTELPPGPGGIGTHAFELARNLARHHAVTIVAPQRNASPEDVDVFNRAHGLSVRTISTSTGPIALLKRIPVARRAMRDIEPDLVIGSGEWALWVAAGVARLGSTPFVAIAHGGEITVRQRWRRWLTRQAFDRADCAISVSRYTEGRLLKLGARPRRTAIVHNGADPARFAHDSGDNDGTRIRAELGVRDEPLLVTVGSVTRRKAQDVVIRSLPLLSVPAHYVAIGLPNERESVEAIARDLDVADRVHLLGIRSDDDVLDALNACDVFCLTSRHAPDGDFEGFGIAVTEAAMVGRPAVVASGSGVEESVVPGVTGLVAAVDDPVSTASAIDRLLTDRALRTSMGEAARELALSEGTWSARIDEYERLLVQLVDERPRLGAGEFFDTVDRHLAQRFVPEARARVVVDLLRGRPARRVLDLGCGDGTVATALPGAERLVLVDASPNMLEAARKRLPAGLVDRTDLILTDVFRFEPDGAFDVVLAIGFLAYVEFFDDLFRRAHRWLRPGGVLVVQLTDIDNVVGRLTHSFYRRRARRQRLTLRPTSATHVIQRAAFNGLTLVEMHSSMAPPPGTARLLGVRWLSRVGRVLELNVGALGWEKILVFERSGREGHAER